MLLTISRLNQTAREVSC